MSALGGDGLAIERLTIPESTASPEFAAFAAHERLFFDAEAEAYGTTELAYTAEETLEEYHDQENQPQQLFAAWDGSRLAGRARIELEAGPAPTTAWLDVTVDPRYRRSGLGTRLANHVEHAAAAVGVQKVIVYASAPPTDGPRLPAPTGFGSVGATTPSSRFLLGRGYRLEQVARCSRLALPVDVSEFLDDARRASGPDYRLHSWVGRTDERWLDDFAMLRTRMSTEEPDAGLDEPEDTWSVQRVRETEARAEAGPLTTLVSAVEHVPTGRLCAFTALGVPRELDRPAHQRDTLVLPEHRGHRLGMLLKAANIRLLETRHPGHPSIVTFNAEENRPMLDVNEAVGFVPIGYDAAWRRDL